MSLIRSCSFPLLATLDTNVAEFLYSALVSGGLFWTWNVNELVFASSGSVPCF